MSEDAIVQEIVYPHPPARVWRALTSSRALAAWLMPNDFEPRVGHNFTFKTEPMPGWSGVVYCRVVELREPEQVAYTWRGAPDMPETLVTFTLEPLDEGTRLRLVHSGFAAGGPGLLSIRDMLAQGWASNLLRKQLPNLLDAMASEEEEAL